MSASGVGSALKRSADTTRKLRMVGADHEGAREKDDFYPTPPELTEGLLSVERFSGPIWEPACGDGAISRVLEAAGHSVVSHDLVNRGYGSAGHDFLMAWRPAAPNLITNPPYKLGEQFWRHAFALGCEKVAFMCRLTWLEGKARRDMFRDCPPARVWVHSARPKFQRGRLATANDKGGMLAHAWFVADRAHSGPPTLGWI